MVLRLQVVLKFRAPAHRDCLIMTYPPRGEGRPSQWLMEAPSGPSCSHAQQWAVPGTRALRQGVLGRPVEMR
eukprot:3472687-Alexandrium_andersonii.AAC.1